MVYLSYEYHLIGTGILIFRQVEVTIIVAENDCGGYDPGYPWQATWATPLGAV